MKVFTNSQLEEAVIRLVKEAREKMVIVSPYINIEGWDSLKNVLIERSNNGLSIEVHTRANTNTKNLEKQNVSKEDIKEKFKNIKLKEVYLHKNLHAKVYFNEKEALTTSLNLLKSSLKNEEIGHLTENGNEFEEILSYFYYQQLIYKNKSQNEIMEKRKLSLEEDIHSVVQDIEFVFNDDDEITVSNDNYKVLLKIHNEQFETITDEQIYDKLYSLYFHVKILNDRYVQKNLNFSEKILYDEVILCLDQKDDEITVLFTQGFFDKIQMEDYLLDYTSYKLLNEALIHLLQALEQ